MLAYFIEMVKVSEYFAVRPLNLFQCVKFYEVARYTKLDSSNLK